MRDKRRVLRHRRLRLYYTAIVFVVMTLSLLATGAIAAALYLAGVWQSLTLMALVWLAVASLLIGAAVSAAISRRVLSPVIRLSEAARRVAQGDFSVRLQNPGRLEELRTTYENFNGMVQELGATETLRNDFVANVSHEFKTPINAIEGYAMLLQDPSLTDAERREYIDRILEGTGRLSTLVSNILMLSKLDNGALPAKRDTFRLDEQIRQALLLLALVREAARTRRGARQRTVYGCGSALHAALDEPDRQCGQVQPEGRHGARASAGPGCAHCGHGGG